MFQRFAENLTAAILQKAVAKLELRKIAADDPKQNPSLPLFARTLSHRALFPLGAYTSVAMISIDLDVKNLLRKRWIVIDE